MSRKSSSSSSTTNNQYNTQNLAIDGVEGVSQVGDGSITITDAGATARALESNEEAVRRALDFGGESLDFADRSTMRALGLVSENTGDLFEHLSDAQERALNVTQGALATVAQAGNDGQAALDKVSKLVMLAMLGMAGVAVFASRK